MEASLTGQYDLHDGYNAIMRMKIRDDSEGKNY